ncbi:FeoA family protein [Anaerofustis stercorihominis]|uniref:FeoA family protein n=1 Tax=Anaerofustis stercorihominis TaxID=214853 RepID=UPI00214C63E4|nr:ferrous iron transport protein A [Anaerofustis stercorihominis]MCR2033261.1 ferrous iron transport protein A [Anaerofustis stercorihominis]
MTLDELKIGQKAIIKSTGGEPAIRRRLLDIGLIPKTTVFIRKVAPLGDPIEINLRGFELTLRKDDANKIEVEVI